VVDHHTALLVEFHERSTTALETALRQHQQAIDHLDLVSPAVFSTDASTRASLWQVRKGLYAAVAGARPTGTTARGSSTSQPEAVFFPACVNSIFGPEGSDAATDGAGATRAFLRLAELSGVGLVIPSGLDDSAAARHGSRRVSPAAMRTWRTAS